MGKAEQERHRRIILETSFVVAGIGGGVMGLQTAKIVDIQRERGAIEQSDLSWSTRRQAVQELGTRSAREGLGAFLGLTAAGGVIYIAHEALNKPRGKKGKKGKSEKDLDILKL